MLAQREPYLLSSFFTSLLGHVSIFVFVLFQMHMGLNLPEQVIYSVTLESGSTLGGISQVPDKKSELAPPKVAKQEAPQEQLEQIKAKPVEPNVDEDAEVSLKEKEDKEVEPKPTVTPKATPKATATPAKQVEKPKPTTKPTPVAKKIEPSQKDINKSYQEAMQRYLGESTDAGGQGFGSAGRGGKGFGGGVIRPPEWFLYRDQLKSYIQRGWNWHDTSKQLVSLIEFKISPEGIISDVRLVESSGNSRYDDSILRAIRKASPVPPAPVHLYEDFKHVVIDFSPE